MPAGAAPTRPLAWEPPYDAGVAPKKKEKKRIMSDNIVTELRFVCLPHKSQYSRGKYILRKASCFIQKVDNLTKMLN